jgi:hypothetical protein
MTATATTSGDSCAGEISGNGVATPAVSAWLTLQGRRDSNSRPSTPRRRRGGRGASRSAPCPAAPRFESYSLRSAEQIAGPDAIPFGTRPCASTAARPLSIRLERSRAGRRGAGDADHARGRERARHRRDGEQHRLVDPLRERRSDPAVAEVGTAEGRRGFARVDHLEPDGTTAGLAASGRAMGVRLPAGLTASRRLVSRRG